MSIVEEFCETVFSISRLKNEMEGLIINAMDIQSARQYESQSKLPQARISLEREKTKFKSLLRTLVNNL